MTGMKAKMKLTMRLPQNNSIYGENQHLENLSDIGIQLLENRR